MSTKNILPVLVYGLIHCWPSDDQMVCVQFFQIVFVVLAFLILFLLHPLLVILLFLWEFVRWSYFNLRLLCIEIPTRCAQFGRTADQNYTVCSGAAGANQADEKQISPEQRRINDLHSLIGQHPKYPEHIKKKEQGRFYDRWTLDQLQMPNLWLSPEDKAWLRKEEKYRCVLEGLQEAKRGMRACAKATLPLVGLIWLICTETMIGGGSVMGCTVCQLGGEGSHWHFATAINFHLGQIGPLVSYEKFPIYD